MFINQEFRRIRKCFINTEDKSRLAENFMKILFKCINVVDYGQEVFNIMGQLINVKYISSCGDNNLYTVYISCFYENLNY